MELEAHKTGSFETHYLHTKSSKLLQEKRQDHSNPCPFWIALCEVQNRGEYGPKKKWEMQKENVEQILKIIQVMS